jgi:serine/threonine-protein kinase HipA
MPARDEAPRGPLRFSLAGMQLKFSVIFTGDRLTVPVTGEGGRYILKLPGAYPMMPLVEFATTEWARRSGIDVVHTKLVGTDTIDGLPEEVQVREPTALLVERFDRSAVGGPRIHQEDFAQVFGVWSTDKYGREARRAFRSVANVVARVCGAADLEELLRRLVFVVLSGNADAHLKNWSLRYESANVPRLSPAYDLVSTCVFPGHAEDELPLRLAEVWRFKDVRLAHFGRLGAEAGYGEERALQLAKVSVEQIRDAWSGYASEAPLDRDQRATLEAHLARVQL